MTHLQPREVAALTSITDVLQHGYSGKLRKLIQLCRKKLLVGTYNSLVGLQGMLLSKRGQSQKVIFSLVPFVLHP